MWLIDLIVVIIVIIVVYYVRLDSVVIESFFAYRRPRNVTTYVSRNELSNFRREIRDKMNSRLVFVEEEMHEKDAVINNLRTRLTTIETDMNDVSYE
jgi:hypothetical protein